MSYRQLRPDSMAGVPSNLDDRGNATAPARQHNRGRGAELLSQLRRRAEAARRLPPLPHSGQRDPLRPAELTDRVRPQ